MPNVTKGNMTGIATGAGTAVRRRTRRRASSTGTTTRVQQFATPRASSNFNPGTAREELYGLLQSQHIDFSGNVSKTVHDQAAGLIDYWMTKTLGL
jgi:hypothetical protein